VKKRRQQDLVSHSIRPPALYSAQAATSTHKQHSPPFPHHLPIIHKNNSQVHVLYLPALPCPAQLQVFTKVSPSTIRLNRKPQSLPTALARKAQSKQASNQ